MAERESAEKDPTAESAAGDTTTTIRRVLADCRVWAVVGLGDNPDRPAHGVARFLQQQGKKIVPVHPSAATVLGEQGYASLADVPFPVDCVDVFRRSEVAGETADEAVAIGAKAVWFQLGVVDEAAYARTTAAGLDMVMDHCPAIEWAANGPSGR
ncbi:CoA-binding protein [Actinosynnema pretiosum subsp. pretiosum]|uniref:CoA-binding domain protein n=2 Tax=Actinosynnema TaxID=40566 RepID=C6WB71_ACTMD|nr:CoA-binding protein [Actinosynnema mirum]ACU39362.1 CoA-binding domain protein [Actinosynnema mirum DSM 43827]AXX32960.1 Succinyl-CoA synthetase, alpha subunit-related enzymes [Actinosynnema pretiosum subsp. pretiosum]QUF03180.1 CoA-binding protein [Actinosynnema pretiosum subsp. pretiosum]